VFGKLLRCFLSPNPAFVSEFVIRLDLDAAAGVIHVIALNNANSALDVDARVIGVAPVNVAEDPVVLNHDAGVVVVVIPAAPDFSYDDDQIPTRSKFLTMLFFTVRLLSCGVNPNSVCGKILPIESKTVDRDVSGIRID